MRFLAPFILVLFQSLNTLAQEEPSHICRRPDQFRLQIDQLSSLANQLFTLPRPPCPMSGIPIFQNLTRPYRNGHHEPYIAGANTTNFVENNPNAAFRPIPFYYADDVNLACTIRNTVPFVISGLNCTSVIAQASSITGVSLETLSLRARGLRGEGQFAMMATDTNHPEWHDVTQDYMRVSGQGFIARKFQYHSGEPNSARTAASHELRRLLIQDNLAVQAMNLTHQQVAAPVLQAIEQNMRAGIDQRSEITINGARYHLTVHEMGGSVDSLTNDDTDRSHTSVRLRDSGWIGRGCQGSFFNDELFSNRIYTFEHVPHGAPPHTFTIDGLTPHLIHRYGFYQGGEYRKSPQEIAHFFRIQPQGNPWQACAP